MPSAAWTSTQMANPGNVTPAPEMGPGRAAVSRTGQSLGPCLNPIAPATPHCLLLPPANQLSSLLTFRPVVKLSASTKGPLGV